ncbi:hypothetical protein MNBD_GAMMA21-2851 [hydrothermal vent metagenome]|uniref:Uncharacterized protein n=1 Tax=hydrothermal vent metagenome TaxID=652676 RepID=A0A3B1AGE6_9ZZZZ
MAATVDEITMNYEENGQQLVKELDKVILTKGAWSTILFKYQDWNRKDEEFGPTKFSIRRYQKREGSYRPKSKFNISSVDQAKKVIAGLAPWIEEADKEAEKAD